MTKKKLSPLQAIKEKCKDSCCCGDTKSWKECSVQNCPLWPYRFGKRPKSLPFEKYSQKVPLFPMNFEKNEVLEAGLTPEEQAILYAQPTKDGGVRG